MAFVVYYNLISFSQAWVSSGRLGMGAALALLHGSAFAASLALLWWRDHAAVLHWRRRATAATAHAGAAA